MSKKPGLTTIKTLFALSCNRCAYPGCDLRLTDPAWGGVKADIAHIRGEKPGAARYAPEIDLRGVSGSGDVVGSRSSLWAGSIKGL